MNAYIKSSKSYQNCNHSVQVEKLREALNKKEIKISLISIVSYDNGQAYFVKVNSYQQTDIKLVKQIMSEYGKDKLGGSKSSPSPK